MEASPLVRGFSFAAALACGSAAIGFGLAIVATALGLPIDPVAGAAAASVAQSALFTIAAAEAREGTKRSRRATYSGLLAIAGVSALVGFGLIAALVAFGGALAPTAISYLAGTAVFGTMAQGFALAGVNRRAKEARPVALPA